MKKKFLSFLLLTVMGVTNFYSITANADTLDDYKLNLLVQHGYTVGTAEALPEEAKNEIYESLLNNPNSVDITTTFLEVDALSEIEAFLSHTDEELIDIGLDQSDIDENNAQINTMINMTDKELKENYKYNDVEIKLLKKSVENGKKIRNNEIKVPSKNDTSVNASGTIAASKLAFTQNVTDNTPGKAPNYRVQNSFDWATPTLIGGLSDSVVIAWGGGLNLDTNSALGNSKYYVPNGAGTAWSVENPNPTKTIPMTYVQKIQEGITYTFKQNDTGKVRNGYASTTIYQTKYQGYDTNVVSIYAHKTISVGANITISVSNTNASITPNFAYDSTPQKSKAIKY